MKKWLFAAFISTALLGSLWHFLYTWWDHSLVALFAPMDESIWEHLKLLYWPVLPAILVLGRRFGRPMAAGLLTALLVMPLLLICVYYGLAAGFSLGGPGLHIGLYLMTLAAGFGMAGRSARTGLADRWLGELVMLAALYGCVLVLFSVACPTLPIFLPPTD